MRSVAARLRQVEQRVSALRQGQIPPAEVETLLAERRAAHACLYELARRGDLEHAEWWDALSEINLSLEVLADVVGWPGATPDLPVWALHEISWLKGLRRMRHRSVDGESMGGLTAEDVERLGALLVDLPASPTAAWSDWSEFARLINTIEPYAT